MPAPEEWGDVMACLAPGWAADGPRVQDFQRAAARWFGAERGIAVNSGSTALQLALRAVGAGPGTQVAVPAYCCAALLNSISAAGAEPLIVDAEPGGYHLALEDLSQRWSSQVAAIVVVHMFGDPLDTAAFRGFGVPIIEDCAQSVGAMRHGRYTGADGDLAIGSFYATKVFTTGHGGLVTSSNPELADAVADLTEYDNRDEWQPRFSVGMSEVQAALGLWQLERLPNFLSRRRAIADYYTGRTLAKLGLSPANRPVAGAEPIFFRYVLRARSADEAFQRLRALGVDAKRPVYRPLHHYLGGAYPYAQAAHEQIVSLPIYPTLTDEEVERVAEAVIELADLWI
jgi:dTDP-4-amino-4,6-dideoxygalactose transaminase